MNTSLYLSQSYQDAWDDYKRSLILPGFPVWDHIILTASNEHQAAAYRAQIDARSAHLPERTKITVIPDEGGVRVGSGGATLSVLKWLKENGGWEGKRILVIHSGGDSKRVPQYSALGKLFSPVPRALPDGRNSTLFDEFIIAMSAVPGRFREGMLLLSGDVLLIFNALLIDWSGSGAAAISFKEDVSTGRHHGVFLRGEDGNVRRFLHKQSTETLREVGAVNSADCVDIDTGALIFGVDLLDSLWSLISVDGAFDEDKYHIFVNSRVRLSLYGDFVYPLATDSTLEAFYEEAPEGVYCDELIQCRRAVWEALRSYRIKLMRLFPSKFIHFGTTGEILRLMTGGVDEYKDLGWSRIVNSSSSVPSYNSVISPMASVGLGIFAECSYIHSGASVGAGSLVSFVDVESAKIPARVVVHGLKQINGRFVCRIYGVNDNPKENRLFGHQIPESLAPSLWTAPLYPEKDTIKEALDSAIKLYDLVSDDKWDEIERGKSLAEGFSDADPQAILAWSSHMEELVAMNRIDSMIKNSESAADVPHLPPLTNIQKKWLSDHIEKAGFGRQMRLHYYVGCALRDETMISKAFSSLSSHILTSTLKGLKENTEARICTDELEVRLPLRVNFGGGWSDTPPYCNEKGGTVLNAAITVAGSRPVLVKLTKLSEKKIVFESRDMDTYAEFDTIEPLQSVGDPFDSFVLQKAALLACGVIPAQGGSLAEILDRIGGGFLMNTEVTGIPKGSGLGTSSILAAAVVKALFNFLAIPYTEDDLYSHVLCMEQIMSTGGGWQDQAGGVTDGIKYITSRPGLKQQLKVEHIRPESDAMDELNRRFALIYTGQRRLARNLLRDVVGRYIGNDTDAVYALNEIQRNATLQKFELERGNIDAFAQLLSEHWELSKLLDRGSTNTLIDQIFDSCDDLLAGKMICGAGGGGFLQVVTRADVTKAELRERLRSVFSDTDIGVWNCKLL
ncbi:MAG: bifunctional fucokinase/L-fucose-1-P-guanylyltransferase [Lachnospiraceae bacterium]|nr:bifunctional fucokinase/L-fucose-1-P-guanylyltransferase [Lachnospiraceae bacterium]